MRALPIFVMAACLCLPGLAGCSTASDEKAVMTSFAAATGAALGALQEYDQAASTRSTEIVRGYAVAKPVGVTIVDGDCLTSSPRCRLVFKKSPDDAEPSPLTTKTLIPEHIAAAVEIAAYANALQQLTDADSRAEVAASLDKIAASISSLANLVQPGAETGVRGIVGPSAMLLSWAYGKYQETTKLRALQAATESMDPVMQSATEKFGRIAHLGHLANKALGAGTVQEASAAFDSDRSDANLQRLIAATEDFDRDLSTPPAAIFVNIGKAHRALTQALVSGPQSMAEVYRDLNRVVEDAETLHKIAQEFRKAADS